MKPKQKQKLQVKKAPKIEVKKFKLRKISQESVVEKVDFKKQALDLLHEDVKVRNEFINNLDIKTVYEIDYLTSIINTALTHINFRVRASGLKLVGKLIASQVFVDVLPRLEDLIINEKSNKNGFNTVKVKEKNVELLNCFLGLKMHSKADSEKNPLIVASMVDYFIEFSEKHVRLVSLKIINLIFTENESSIKLLQQHVHPQFPFGDVELDLEYSLIGVKVDVLSVYQFLQNNIIGLLESGNYGGKIFKLTQSVAPVLDNAKKFALLKKLVTMEAQSQIIFQVIKHLFQSVAVNHTSDSDIFIELIENWILGLPKLLYRLRLKSVTYSKEILGVINLYLKSNGYIGHDLLASRSPSMSTRFMKELEPKLIPLFYSFLPSGPIKGVIVHYPRELQFLLIGLLYYLQELCQSMLQSVVACCRHLPVGTVICMLDVLKARQQLGLGSSIELYHSSRLSIVLDFSHGQIKDLQSNWNGLHFQKVFPLDQQVEYY